MSGIEHVPGTPIVTDPDAPDDKVILTGGRIIMSKLAFFRVQHGTRVLWTRHMLGVTEAERDRRKYR
jgi:hypothetical protein